MPRVDSDRSCARDPPSLPPEKKGGASSPCAWEHHCFAVPPMKVTQVVCAAMLTRSAPLHTHKPTAPLQAACRPGA